MSGSQNCSKMFVGWHEGIVAVIDGMNRAYIETLFSSQQRGLASSDGLSDGNIGHISRKGVISLPCWTSEPL